MNECIEINLTATGKTRRESRIDGEIVDCCFPWTESNDSFSWVALQNQAQNTCLILLFDENDLLTSCA